MVQRKVPSKLGIQADHVKSDNNKNLPNFKLSSNSQHLDAKNRGADMKKKKMKKSKSIKLSDLEALQTSSSPSRKSLPQLGKPPPLHNNLPTTSPSPSPQKQHHMLRSTDGSPNYMKPTSSSHAKKELFRVSLRNTTQSGNCPDFKNLPNEISSDYSKANNSVVSSKKPVKALARSSSLSLVRTLTKTTSFKASRKSTRASMCAAARISTTTTAATITPHKATCSSTLKDSKFPSYLMLTPGGTESEGTSAMKVCPYTYCSLNGHHGAALAPLKSFMSQRRRVMKTQKSMKLMEALSPRRSKIPGKEDSDIEQSFYGGKPAYDEIAGMDIFIEIYAKEKEEIGKIDFHKEIEDQESIKSKIENNGIAAEENDDVKQASPTVVDTTPKFEIDLEESFEKSFDDDVAIEADAKGSFFHEQIAGDFHEEISMGSYCSDAGSYDAEHMEDVEMDDSDFKAVAMVWEDEKFLEFDADSSVFTEEDADSKVESLSESSHDVSITWLDETLCSYYEDIMNEEIKEVTNAKESNCFEDQPHGIGSVLEGTSGSTETQESGYSSGGISCDQSSFKEKVFEYLTSTEENGGESEKHVDDEAICKLKVLDEEKIGLDQCPNMGETWNIDETCDDGYSSQENNEESIDQANQLFDAQDESIVTAQEDDMLVKDKGKANTGSIGGEEKDSTKNWKGGNRQKRPIENDDEMRNFNPREPNFLPLVPEPEPEKVDLKHHMMDERKNADDWMIDCALRQYQSLIPA
ncbi:hypothetical protein RIF29_38197 [Crotalaria pallida]|uniref:Calmodulin-binding domain-containing protein n=1 Tax=Crotalaria pallida TaxID=3830 RepID=A0AAN9E189_CROPI